MTPKTAPKEPSPDVPPVDLVFGVQAGVRGMVLHFADRRVASQGRPTSEGVVHHSRWRSRTCSHSVGGSRAAAALARGRTRRRIGKVYS
jgi:hypothetical protein